MNTILIGNIIAFVGCSLMVFVGLIKEKKRILSVQCLQFAIQGASNLILGGFTGFIANVVSIIRNVVFSKVRSTVALKMLFVAVQLLLSAGSLGDGVISWLPVLAAALFTWFIDVESEVILKIVIIVTQILWLVYDLCHTNYVSAAFDVFTMISTVVGIYLILRDKNKAGKPQK